MEKEIQQISFPNTSLTHDEMNWYRKEAGCTFRIIEKNGEMASINWIEISKDGKVVAEIKESVCNLYF